MQTIEERLAATIALLNAHGWDDESIAACMDAAEEIARLRTALVAQAFYASDLALDDRGRSRDEWPQYLCEQAEALIPNADRTRAEWCFACDWINAHAPSCRAHTLTEEPHD